MQIGLARVATYLSLVLGEGEAWLLLLESPIHDASARIEWLRGGQLVVSDWDAISIVAGDAGGDVEDHHEDDGAHRDRVARLRRGCTACAVLADSALSIRGRPPRPS